MAYILTGDIGGTKTNLALFKGPLEQLAMVTVRTYATKSAVSPLELIGRFLREVDAPPLTGACFGIAGPVVQGTATTTNLPWTVSAPEIAAYTNLTPVALINDLAAMASAIPILPPEKIIPLNKVPLHAEGNIGLLAAGTGLGEALLMWHDGRHVSCASEGGHKDFASQNDQQFRLHQSLASQHGHVSVERLLSGPGLVNIYQFLRRESGQPEPVWLRDLFGSQDHAAVVSGVALKGHDPVCVAALDLFVSIYGAEAGNIALQGMTTGGIFLGGGIAPKIIPALAGGAFMTAFLAKGRLETLLRRIPVRIIQDSQAPLWGAAAHLLKLQPVS